MSIYLYIAQSQYSHFNLGFIYLFFTNHQVFRNNYDGRFACSQYNKAVSAQTDGWPANIFRETRDAVMYIGMYHDTITTGSITLPADLQFL